MTPPVRLTLLGTPGITGRSRDPRGAPFQGQALALLSVLAWAGDRGIPREKLVALFWPEVAAYRASHRLRQLVHRIRSGPGFGGLITGRSELRLDPERVVCDLWEFTEARKSGRFERAVELYGGPFLDGFFLHDAIEFEHWVEGRRLALEREYQETLEALAVQAELRHDTVAAADWWGRLAEHDPLSSGVTMHLMAALASTGYRARALEQARLYQEQVRDKLDASPNPAVSALAKELRKVTVDRAGDAGTPRPLVLGVLPLDSWDGSPETKALAHSLTEELTTAVSVVPGIRVASRTWMAGTHEGASDVRVIGERLGLDRLLEGSVRQAGAKMRVMMRLVDVGDGHQLWSQCYDRVVGEGFEALDALAMEVVEAMRGHLAKER
jgi:DNA-binding SARP family transcriptional activator